jgi:hypothetical protein
MLKKSSFSPAQSRRAEPRPFPKLRSRFAQRLQGTGSGITGPVPLVSGDSRRSEGRQSPSLAAALPAEQRVLARWGWAGENRGLFEHPDGHIAVTAIPLETGRSPLQARFESDSAPAHTLG